MPNVSPQTNGPLGVDVTAIETSPKFDLGTEFTDKLGTTYRYCKSIGALAQYKLSYHDTSYILGAAATTALIGLTNSRPVCVPQMSGGFTAANQYGWVAVKGPLIVSALTLCAAVAQVYSTATPGSVDDTAASMCKIVGLSLASTVGGSTADTAAFAATYMTATP